MHYEINQHISSIQVMTPNLGDAIDAFKLMQEPGSSKVNKLSLVVFLRRFSPTTFNVSRNDGEAIFNYLGLSKSKVMPF
jgi:hypothetical protein